MLADRIDWTRDQRVDYNSAGNVGAVAIAVSVGAVGVVG